MRDTLLFGLLLSILGLLTVLLVIEGERSGVVTGTHLIENNTEDWNIQSVHLESEGLTCWLVFWKNRKNGTASQVGFDCND